MTTERVVIDTGNHYPPRDGQIPELDSTSFTESEYLLRHRPEAKVVKVFNKIGFRLLLNLVRRSGVADRSALPIAGDSPTAKAVVSEFLDSIAYQTVDAGSQRDGWPEESVGCAAATLR
jgi:predicted dinucleotide-binding enzyme